MGLRTARRLETALKEQEMKLGGRTLAWHHEALVQSPVPRNNHTYDKLPCFCLGLQTPRLPDITIPHTPESRGLWVCLIFLFLLPVLG